MGDPVFHESLIEGPKHKSFLSDPGVPWVQSMGPVVSHSLTERGFADLIDVTLEDNANKGNPRQCGAS